MLIIAFGGLEGGLMTRWFYVARRSKQKVTAVSRFSPGRDRAKPLNLPA